jgi:hypothetical protein
MSPLISAATVAGTLLPYQLADASVVTLAEVEVMARLLLPDRSLSNAVSVAVSEAS